MFEAFQESDYRRFWVSQFFSNIGSWMQTVAQGYLVYRLTDSPFLLGFVGFAVTQESPHLALGGIGQPAGVQVLEETRLVDSRYGPEAH